MTVDELEATMEEGTKDRRLSRCYMSNTFCLPWLSEHGLLPSPVNGPLSSVPISVQIDVIKPLASHLSHRKPNSVQPTISHILWTMDCLGQAFSLPMNCEDVISDCLDIYGAWLNGRDAAPQCLRDHPEYFFPGIIRHMSLLFQPRGSTVNEKEVLLHEYFGQLYSGGGVGSAASRMRQASSTNSSGLTRGERYTSMHSSPATRRRTIMEGSSSPAQRRRAGGQRSSVSSSPSPGPSPVVSGGGTHLTPPPQAQVVDASTAHDQPRCHSTSGSTASSVRGDADSVSVHTIPSVDTFVAAVGTETTGTNTAPSAPSAGSASVSTDADAPPTGAGGTSGPGVSPHTLSAPPTSMTAAAKRKAALDQQAQAQQVALCRRVLQLLEGTLGVQRRAWWTEDVLRVLIGTCDSVASLTVGQSAFADALADDVLRTMFMTWQVVASGGAGRPLSDSMWVLFRSHCTRWRHQVSFVNHWSSATATCSDRLLDTTVPRATRCNDGTDNTATTPTGTNDHAPEAVPVEDGAMAVTIWRRMLCLLGDPATLDSGIKATAMVSVALIIEKLLSVQMECGLPSGNSILDVFRTWLFHAATDTATPKGARQTALSTISRIFHSSNPGTPFKSEFLAQYYYLLISGLQDAALRDAILLTTSEVFLSNLEGTAVLVRPFLTAADRVFSQSATDADGDADLEMMQYAASKLVASLVCMPELPPFAPDSGGADVAPAAIEHMLMQCCCKGLAVCADPDTTQILLHAVFLLHIQGTIAPGSSTPPCPPHPSVPPEGIPPTATGSTGLAPTATAAGKGTYPSAPAAVSGHPEGNLSAHANSNGVTIGEVIDIILRHLETRAWPAPVTLTAFAILRGYVGMHAHAPTVPLRVVGVVCAYISAQVKQPPHRHTKHLHTMILAGYNCLQYAVTVAPDLTRNDTALRSILRAVAMGLTGSNLDDQQQATREWFVRTKVGPRILRSAALREGQTTTRSPSYRVQEAAALLFSTVLGIDQHHSLDPPVLDAVLAERAYGMQAGCVRRYFVLDGNSIACVIVPMDAPCCADGRAPSPGDVLVILRDRQGRYVWRLRDDTTEEPLVGIPHGVDGSCSADVFSDSSTATSRSNSGYDGSGGPAGVSEPETTAAVSIPDATATALQSLATSDTVQQVRDRQDHVCRIIEAQVAVDEALAADSNGWAFDGSPPQSTAQNAPNAPARPASTTTSTLQNSANRAMPAIEFLPLVTAWYNNTVDANTPAASAGDARTAGTFVEICDNVDAFARALHRLDALAHNEIVTVRVVCLDASGYPRSLASLLVQPPPSFAAFHNTVCAREGAGTDLSWGGSVKCVWETLVLHFVLSDTLSDAPGMPAAATDVVVLWADTPMLLDVVSRTIDVAAVLVSVLPNGLYFTSVSCGKDYAPTLLTHPYPLGRRVLREVLCRAIANLVLQSIWSQDGYVFPRVRRQKEIQKIIHTYTTPTGADASARSFASTLHHYLVTNLAAAH